MKAKFANNSTLLISGVRLVSFAESRFIADDSANEAQQLHAVFDLDASRAALKSRAGTALPQIVVVITENRQREVGMCYSDLRSGHTISLCQFTDNQSSSQTLSLLDMLRPVVIAFSVTQKDRQLFQRVFEWVGRQNQLASATGQAAGQQRLHTTQFLPRKAFDEVKGEQLLRTLAVDGDLSSGQGKYLALASLCAWKAYVEAYQHLLLSPKRSVLNLCMPSPCTCLWRSRCAGTVALHPPCTPASPFLRFRTGDQPASSARATISFTPCVAHNVSMSLLQLPHPVAWWS